MHKKQGVGCLGRRPWHLFGGVGGGGRISGVVGLESGRCLGGSHLHPGTWRCDQLCSLKRGCIVGLGQCCVVGSGSISVLPVVVGSRVWILHSVVGI